MEIGHLFEKRALNALAKRMQEGDERAAADLYDRLIKKTFGFAMHRVGNRAVAEDLAQDIFLKVVDRIQTFDPAKGAFTSWFWQIARNVVIDHYRSAHGETRPFSEFADEDVERFAVHDPAPAAEQRHLLNEVSQFLQSLSDEEREIFELRMIADMPYRDMEELLGKNEGALRVAVSRIKAKMRKNILSA